MYSKFIFPLFFYFISIVFLYADGPGTGKYDFTVNNPEIKEGDIVYSFPGHGGRKAAAGMHNGYFILPVYLPQPGNSNLMIFDVSDPTSPKTVFASRDNLNKYHDQNTDANYLSDIVEFHDLNFMDNKVLLHTHTGIRFVDLSDIENPETVGWLKGTTQEVTDKFSALQGSKYLLTGRGKKLYDISDLTDIKMIADYRSVLGNGEITHLTPVGNLLYAGLGYNRTLLKIIDISDPLEPKLISKVDSSKTYTSSNGIVRDLYGENYSGRINGYRFYGFHSKKDLMALDVKNPLDIKVISPWPSQLTGSDNQPHLTENWSEVIQNESQLSHIKAGYGYIQDDYMLAGYSKAIWKVNLKHLDNQNATGNLSGGKIYKIQDGTDWDTLTTLGNVVFQGDDEKKGGSKIVVHNLTPDNTPPKVNMVIPVNGAVDQALTSRIGITLTDLVKNSSINSSTFAVRPVGTTSSISGSYSNCGGVVNFCPDQPLLPNTSYEVIIQGIKDYSGNSQTEVFVSTFSTVGNNSNNLTVSIAQPDPVEVGQIMALFVDTTKTGVEFRYSYGDGTVSEWLSTNQATHTYSSPGHYTVTVDARDSEGNLAQTVKEVVIHRPVLGKTSHSNSIIYDSTFVWVVNPDQNTVAQIDTSTNELLQVYSVGKRPSCLVMDHKKNLWVTNRDDDSVTVIDTTSQEVIKTISLDYGSRPFGIVSHSNYIFISLMGDKRVLKYNANDFSRLANYSKLKDVKHLAVTHDGSLLATRFKSDFHKASGNVYVINSSKTTLNLIKDNLTEDNEDMGRGIPNYLGQIAVNPDGTEARLTAKKDNIFRGQFLDGNPLVFENTVRAVAHRIDLTTFKEAVNDRIDLDNNTLPQAIAYTQFGDYFAVAFLGNNTIEIIDSYTGEIADTIDMNDSPQGLGPLGLAFNDDSSRLYVHNFLSRKIRVFNTESLIGTVNISKITDITTSLNELLPQNVLAGKRIFYNASNPSMSSEGYISCASCHLDGGQDGMVWDFTDRGEGLRNTISLRGRRGMGHGPVHWTANFDEIQDFENDIRNGFAGLGFLSDQDFASTMHPLLDPKKTGKSEALDNLAAYVSSLTEYPRSPYRKSNGSYTGSALKGELIFKELNCAQCHSGEDFTNSLTLQRFDVGTFKASSGKRLGGLLDGFDVPTLKGLWNTAPYFHDGSAKSIMQLIKKSGAKHGSMNDLSSTEKKHLKNYLMQLDGSSTNPGISEE